MLTHSPETCPASPLEKHLKRQDSALALGAADTIAVELPYTALDGEKRTVVVEIAAQPRFQRRRAYSVSAASARESAAKARKQLFVAV